MEHKVHAEQSETERGIMQKEKIYLFSEYQLYSPRGNFRVYTGEDNPIYSIDICSKKSGMSLSSIRELKLMKLLYLKCEHWTTEDTKTERKVLILISSLCIWLWKSLEQWTRRLKQELVRKATENLYKKEVSLYSDEQLELTIKMCIVYSVYV